MNIHKKLNILFAQGGTGQTERLLPELIDNNLLISDRQLSDHLRFLYLYTDLLAYYDTTNERMDANIWRKFLEQDDTVIRSLILHTNIDKLSKQIHKEFAALRRNRTAIWESQHMKNLLSTAKDLIILLDYWHRNLFNEDVIRAKLDAIIHEELNNHISNIYKILIQQSASSTAQIGIEFCNFIDQKCTQSPLWQLKSDAYSDQANGQNVSNEQVIDIIDDFFDTALHTVHQLKELSSNDYFDTLQSQNKEPHMALLIAFLQLLQYADEHLNYIPQKTLDHYYRHILKFNNNPSIPDQANIHFSISPKHHFAIVPAGSHLIAKNPLNGENILFKTDRTLTVNTATIGQINTLLTTKKAAQSGYTTIELSATTYPKECVQLMPMLLFPPPQHNAIANIQSEQQQLAIMIGSPVFYLAEGMRTIHIKWKLTTESFKQLIKKNPNKTLADETFLEQLASKFNAMLLIQITTKEGWFSLSEETVSLEFIHETCSLYMIINLNAEVPPMEKLPHQYQGKIINPGTPAISMSIREHASLIGLYYLNGLQLEKLDIKVQVQQYRGLVLQNQLGIIDNSQIFEPFGPLAKPDSSFYIGSGEVFAKNLTALKIDIKWDNIPAIEGGLKSYYDAYPMQVTNNDFKVNISYLNHQHWNPFYAQHRQSIPLFQVIKCNKGSSEQLDACRTINDIDITALGITKSNEPLEVSVYGAKTVAGFLKLKLNVPEQAFGHAVYPNVMSEVLIKNAQQSHKENKIILNEPYTPRIKSITIDYEAEESIVLNALPGEEEEKYLNSFVHLSSFGYTKIFPSKLTTPATLLPLIQDDVSFIAIGIEDLNSHNLTMHIAIEENRQHLDKEIQSPTWFYLFENVWLPLEEAIVVDGTNGCAKSGIIIFDLDNLPNKVAIDNTEMRPGLIWVKAQFMGDLSTLPNIVGIYLQAVTVSRVMDHHGVFSAPILPSNTIEELKTPIEGIELVVQPIASFGGRQFEKHQAFYRRVSERLRHKNRAISTWDYERIILEKFPQIFQVKCINHTVKSMNSMIAPGHLTIVVLTKPGHDTSGMFSIVSQSLLTEIKNYIQSVSTPFLTCEVVNPSYEDIKVNVTVNFKSGYEKGLLINILQQDLRNFLSPWLFNDPVDIQLGGEVSTAKVIDFINSRYYIEGIINFSIFKYVGQSPNLKLDKVTHYDSCLRASYPWSVMVSAKNHKISAVNKFDVAVKLRDGNIGEMAIGEDFIIGPFESPPNQDVTQCVSEDVPIPSLQEYYLITQKYIKTDHVNY